MGLRSQARKKTRDGTPACVCFLPPSAALQRLQDEPGAKTETSQGVALLFVCWAWLVTMGKSEETTSRSAHCAHSEGPYLKTAGTQCLPSCPRSSFSFFFSLVQKGPGNAPPSDAQH